MKIRALLALITLREWFGPYSYDTLPGRRVSLRVGNLLIERLYGPVRWEVLTGEQMRRAGFRGRSPEHVQAWRLSIPWVSGTLIFSVAIDECIVR